MMTPKEQLLLILKSIQEGMDEPGCGWLHELDPFNNSKVCAGVLSSLIKKDLVTSTQEDDCYWVEIKV